MKKYLILLTFLFFSSFMVFAGQDSPYNNQILGQKIASLSVASSPRPKAQSSRKDKITLIVIGSIAVLSLLLLLVILFSGYNIPYGDLPMGIAFMGGFLSFILGLIHLIKFKIAKKRKEMLWSLIPTLIGGTFVLLGLAIVIAFILLIFQSFRSLFLLLLLVSIVA